MKPFMITLFLISMVCAFAQAQNDTITPLYKGENYSKYLNVIYPGYAIENSIQGTVLYKIHINKEGCLDSLVILDSPHKVLSDEVKRAYTSLKCGWTPIDGWIDKKFAFNYQ